MFIGVILCNLIVVLLAFCGAVNVYNCLTSMEKEMGVDVFMESFVPACTPLFMAACLFMLVQIACQIQRMNIELKMQRGGDAPSASAAAARALARKPNRAAPDTEETRDYFSLEDERKPSRANRSPRPVGHGTRPLKTPPAQPSLDAWSGASERFGASSSSVLPARAAVVVAASPASAAPSAEPSASPAAAATAGPSSVAGAPTSSPEDWPAAPSPEARPAASSPGARVAASSPVDRPAEQTSAPSRSEDATSDGKGGTSSSGSSASRTKRSSSPSFFSLD